MSFQNWYIISITQIECILFVFLQQSHELNCLPKMICNQIECISINVIKYVWGIFTWYPQEEMVIHEKIKRGAIAPSLIFSWITIFSCGYFDYYTLLKFWANSRFRSMMQSILKKRLISLKNVITVDPLKYGIGIVTI